MQRNETRIHRNSPILAAHSTRIKPPRVPSKSFLAHKEEKLSKRRVVTARKSFQNSGNRYSVERERERERWIRNSERFKAAFIRNDFDSCSKLLSQLKRDIYEHAVVLSVKFEDQDAFERDFFQLKPYYTDAHGRLPPSPPEYPILGLNLLRLLVQNRIAEFHIELELLSASAMDNNCIKHAVELEQSFVEGAYNRVVTARHCEHPEWEIKNGFVIFQKAKESAPCKEIPSLQLINQTLSYARELERIV
ncbi:unnamed protein product [Camellia sinensis]